jgi:hypothetical protein
MTDDEGVSKFYGTMIEYNETYEKIRALLTREAKFYPSPIVTAVSALASYCIDNGYDPQTFASLEVPVNNTSMLMHMYELACRF